MATKQLAVNLMFQANTTAAIRNLTQLGQLLSQISSETTIGVNDGSLSRASDAARQLQVHLQNAVNVDTGKIDLSKLDNSLKSAGTNLSTLTTSLQGAGAIGQQAFIKLATAVASAETPMMRVNKRLAELGQTLLNTAKWQLASKAIHGVEGAISSAVQHAEELNNALSDIRVVTGYSKESMASFANDAAKTAKALNTTTTEYAKAALIFYQQGLSGSEVDERTNVVVKLSQVTGQTAQQVSDQMTAIWNNFDNGSKSLEYYADALTKLGAATAASTDEISAGLEKFAAIADTVGLSYETATAAVATVIDKTRQSADVVGTSFKTIFARMEGLTLGETLEDGVDVNKYSEALQSVGVEVLTASGELRSMDAILSDLGEKWQYFGEETKIALAQTVGGIRQYNQMLALMDNWDSVQKNIKLASSATGELTKQQRIWSTSYEAATLRVEKAQDELSESLIKDKDLIVLQDLFAQLTTGIAKTLDAIGGIGPLALMIAAVFSQKLVPILAKGAQTVYQNWRVATGKATDDIVRMQEVVKIGMMDMLNDPKNNISEAMKQQILLSKDLLTAKQKLAQASKTMSEAQRQEAERRMAVYEAMIAETQASLELQDKLANEIKLNQTNLTSNKNRSTLASHAAADKLKEDHVDELGLQDDPDAYVEKLRVEATSKTQKQIKKEAAQSASDYEIQRTQITEKMSGLDSSTPEGATALEEYKKQLESLRVAEEEQQQRYEYILELQKSIGLAARKTADELKKVSMGSVDGFEMDPELEEKSGLDFAADVVEKSNRADAKEAAGNTGYAERQRKGTIAADKRRASAATGQEMLSNVSDSLAPGVDGEGVAVSLENLEKLLTKLNEYKGQAIELNTIASDLNITYTNQGESIQAAASALDGYEQDLAAIKAAEQEREMALRALIEAENAAREAGAGDAAASKKVKDAKAAVTKAETALQAIQTKAAKSFKSLSKESQSYVKQLSSVRTALEKAAKSSKNSTKELAHIDQIFTDLKKGGPDAKKALSELQSTLSRLQSGSREASDGMEVLAQTIGDELVASGMDAQEIEAFIANMEKMGIISPEVASKLRQVGNTGKEMGSKIMSGGQLAVSAISQIGSVAGQLTTAISAVQGVFNAFQEGNTPLETTVALLTSMSMLLPLITGLMTTFNAIQKINAATQLVVNAAKAKGEKLDKKQIATTWAKNAAESSLLVVKIIAAAVEKMGFVGAAVGIALAAATLVSIVALTAAYQAKTKANMEANKAQAESSAGLVEAIDKTQELATEVHNLTTEYEKLAAAGKNTTEALDKMNEKIPELISSYRSLAKEMSDDEGLQLDTMTDELEHLYNVAQLTGDYDAFNKKKAELDNYITEVEYANAMAGGQAAGSLGAKAMSEATNGSVSGNKMTLKLDGSDDSWGRGFLGWTGIGATDDSEYGIGNSKDTKLKERTDEEKVAKSILKKHAKDYYSGGWTSGMFAKEQAEFTVDFTNPAEFVQYYEQLQEAQQEMVRTMSEKQLADSDIYRELNDALEAGKEQYDKMVPMAKAQADSGGKLTEALMESSEKTLKDGTKWTGGVKMEDVDTLEEYLQYKEAFIQLAQSEYGLTESQAKSYLREAEGLSRVSQEYELAAQMLENFSGIDIEDLDASQIKAVQASITEAFGELSDEELSVAVSIAATATSLTDFSEKMQQAMITSTRQSFEKSAEIASEAMLSSVENGEFSLSALYADDNFITYLEDIGMQQVTLTAMSYEEQYRIVSDYYSKINSLVYDSYSAQQELHYQAVAQRQQEIAALKAADANAVATKKDEYATLQDKYNSASTEQERANAKEALNDFEAQFKEDFGFEINSNVEELENELDNLLKQIDELQNKKIEMAMDWSGTDKVEQSLEKTAEFAQLIAKDAKKVGKNYVLTAKQAREWLEVYPELGAIAETTEDGLIQMNEDRVQEFLDGNEAQLDSTIDTKIAELKAEKETLAKELELRKADYEAAQVFAEGKMTTEGVSAEYLTELRKNLTQYYLDLGMDEVEANKAALETMQMNEEQYAQFVADACTQQAENITYAAEAGANAQVDSLSQVIEKWKSFGSYLIENIGTIIVDLGAAILDPTKSVKDVMMNAWNEGTKSISVTADVSNIKANTSSTTFSSLDQQSISAAYQSVSASQSESINAKITELQRAIDSVDGQIDYLEALKNQNLEDYGQEGVGTEELEAMAEAMERYHELTREAEALERAVSQYGDEVSRAFGSDKLAAMAKQKQALADLKEKQEALLRAQQGNVAIDLAKVQTLFGGQAKADAEGKNLSNYSELMQMAQDELNLARETYNTSKQDEDDKETLDKAEKLYEEKIAALEQYEETLDKVAESEEAVRDTGYQIQDLNFENLNTKLELQLEINDSELEKIDYYLEKYADDFYKMAESAALIGSQMTVSKNTIESQKAYMQELKTARENNEISEEDFGTARDEVIAAIQSEMASLLDLDKEMQEYYGNTLAMAQEEIGKYTARLGHLSGVLEHYQSMLSIIGKETDYKSMGIVLQGIADNMANQVKVAEEEYAFYKGEAEKKKALMDSAINDPAAFEFYKKEWEAAEEVAREAQENMLAQSEAWAESMKSVIQNKLSDFASTLEKQLTGGTSFDEMTTSIERAASLQEEYLTTTNQIYETTKMMRTAEKALDETTNIAAKNKLKGFIETTKQLQNQGKLSKYELDMQQAKYDLLLAEIALEEAQNAKSTVRLQRDAEGNFGYVYTADANQVADAQQAVDDAENALYNKQLEGANDYAQKYQQTLAESQDAVSALTQAYFDGEIATEEEYLRRMEETKAYYQEKLQSYSDLYKVATAEDSAVINDAWSTSFMNTAISADEWAASVTDYSNSCGEAFLEWESVVDEVESIVGDSLTSIANNVNNITTESDALVDAITKEGGVIDRVSAETTAVSTLTSAYAAQRAELLALIETQEKYLYGDTKTNTAGLVNESNADKTVTTTTPTPTGYDTGGYTGSWGTSGKLAVLHQKEIVLNADDTENLLNAVDMVRTIIQTIDMRSASAQIGGILSTPGFHNNEGGVLEQNVKIEASFPNVQDRNEIEEAFNNLINKASQYANR